MSRKNEREFIQGADVSDEVFAALNGDGGDQQDEAPLEADDAAGSQQPVVTAEAAPTAPIAPQADPEPKMVDVRALQEARAAEREARENLRKRDEEFARADERMRLLQESWEQQRKQTVEAPKVPSLEEEPLEHIGYRLKAADDRFKTVEERLAAYEKAEEDRKTQFEAERRQQALISDADAVITAAGTKYSDVNEAFEFAANGLKQAIMRHVTGQGLQGPAAIEQGERILRNETVRLAQQCPRDPDQAAEFIRANARYYGWGYQKPQQAQPATAAPQVQQPTLQQRQEQQNRHMSLSGVTGAEPPKTITATELGKMSQAEYNELLKTVAGKKLMEEQFGGY